MPNPKAKSMAYYYVRRVKRKIFSFGNIWAWLKHSARLSIKSSARAWMEDRHYSDYNDLFGRELKNFFKNRGVSGIEDALSLIHKGGRPLRILEDGAGQGIFLEELKQRLQKRGINTITTALSLEKNPELEYRRKTGKIDEVVNGNAEFFVPKKPADAIISMVGSLSYTFPKLRKNHLLKFAYSLRKGGLMMVGFGFYAKTSVRDPLYNIYKGLSENPKERNLPGGLSLKKEMRGIERAFDKRGFDAKFYPYAGTSGNAPNWMLIVRRR